MGHGDLKIEFQIGGILGLLILILDIWAIIKICRSGRAAITIALWSLLIVFFPVFGLLLWLCCGPSDELPYVIIV